MLNTILSFIVTKVLEWLLRTLKVEVEEHLADLAEQKRRGEINEANVKAYEAADERKKRIEAALNLLNRNRT